MFSVTEVTRVIRGVLETAFEEVWIEGEVSNYRQQSSGHQYFTLKDAESQIACVRFARPGLWKKAVALQDGMQVQVRGRLTVYEARGQYQLNVSTVQAAGAGLLQAKFEALKRKLAAEGLFDPERKRTLPRMPRAIGIVTSPSTAALQDILNVLRRRAPCIRVVVSPARVQGEGAAHELIQALKTLERLRAQQAVPIDVIIVARGGGSLEDLWEFNHEELARAIAACAIPVVSAVGHEIDFTIADFVADLRAPTPSAAAELVAPDCAELSRLLQSRAAYLQRNVAATLSAHQRHISGLARSGLFREPRLQLEQFALKLDSAEQSLGRALRDHVGNLRTTLAEMANELRQHRPERHVAMLRQALEPLVMRSQQAFTRELQARRQALSRVTEMLRLLSPQHTIDRGYTITTDEAGQVVDAIEQTKPGAKLITRVKNGQIVSETVRAEFSAKPRSKKPS